MASPMSPRLHALNWLTAQEGSRSSSAGTRSRGTPTTNPLPSHHQTPTSESKDPHLNPDLPVALTVVPPEVALAMAPAVALAVAPAGAPIAVNGSLVSDRDLDPDWRPTEEHAIERVRRARAARARQLDVLVEHGGDTADSVNPTASASEVHGSPTPITYQLPPLALRHPRHSLACPGPRGASLHRGARPGERFAISPTLW